MTATTVGAGGAAPVHAAAAMDPAALLAAADAVAAAAAPGADERDRTRGIPLELVRRMRASGLTAARVPARHGGSDAPRSVVVEATRRVAVADPSLAQIPQSHFVVCELLRLAGGEAAASLWERVRAGDLVANAQAERGSGGALDATVRARGESLVVTGEKHFCTGSGVAQLIAVFGRRVPGDEVVAAVVDADDEAVTILDDWDGLGQRTTTSGTVLVAGARAEVAFSRDAAIAADRGYGAVAQSLHAAIDAGIARGSLERAARAVGSRSDGDTLAEFRLGELAVAVRGAEALLAEAGRVLDGVEAGSVDPAEATYAVAAAKVAAGRAALEASDAVLELGGAAGAVAGSGADRGWRDARTHTLHDSLRRKTHLLGRALSSGLRPEPTAQQ